MLSVIRSIFRGYQKFLKTMFSITVFAGIVLIAAGAASLIRTIVSMASGEQAQPGALGQGEQSLYSLDKINELSNVQYFCPAWDEIYDK